MKKRKKEQKDSSFATSYPTFVFPYLVFLKNRNVPNELLHSWVLLEDGYMKKYSSVTWFAVNVASTSYNMMVIYQNDKCIWSYTALYVLRKGIPAHFSNSISILLSFSSTINLLHCPLQNITIFHNQKNKNAVLFLSFIFYVLLPRIKMTRYQGMFSHEKYFAYTVCDT